MIPLVLGRKSESQSAMLPIRWLLPCCKLSVNEGKPREYTASGTPPPPFFCSSNTSIEPFLSFLQPHPPSSPLPLLLPFSPFLFFGFASLLSLSLLASVFDTSAQSIFFAVVARSVAVHSLISSLLEIRTCLSIFNTFSLAPRPIRRMTR